MGKERRVHFCVIPAAGVGSRWHPLSKYIPKEMLPLGNIPVIERVVIEAIDSGCQHICVVINPDKELLKGYLQERMGRKKRAKLDFIVQEKPRGVADAIYLTKGLIGENNFALVFPDMPIMYKGEPPLKQLIEAFQRLREPAQLLSLASAPDNNMILYDDFIIRGGKSNFYHILGLAPKAPPDVAGGQKRGFHGAGRDIFTPEIFAVIERCLAQKPRGEVGDKEIFTWLFEHGMKVFGYPVGGFVCDTGTPEKYAFANAKFFEKKQGQDFGYKYTKYTPGVDSY